MTGWRNITTMADEIDLTERWVIQWLTPSGMLMRREIGFAYSPTAEPFSPERIAAEKTKVEAEITAEGGVIQ